GPAVLVRDGPAQHRLLPAALPSARSRPMPLTSEPTGPRQKDLGMDYPASTSAKPTSLETLPEHSFEMRHHFQIVTPSYQLRCSLKGFLRRCEVFLRKYELSAETPLELPTIFPAHKKPILDC